MKRLKRAALILLLMCVAGASQSLAQTFTVGDLNYSINDDGVSVTVTGHVDGQNATGSLTIPASVSYGGNSYSVTQIGDFAFQSCGSLTGNLTIPNTVSNIGSHAFSNCGGLSGNLVIPDGVIEIGDAAFLSCGGLNGTLIIPSNVAAIGYSAFCFCGFTGVIYNAINAYYTQYWNQGMFDECPLTSVTIGAGVQSIPRRIFEGCSSITGSVTIPNSVTSIGESAFNNCSGLTGTLTIPEAVTSIGKRAFANTGFTALNYNAINCTYMGYEYGGHVFQDCNALETLNIGESVQTIPDYAFFLCNFSGALNIPNTVTSIGQYAFSNCSGLTGSLTISENVTWMGGGVFTNTNFTTLNYNAVDCSISDSPFSNCSSLTTLNIGNQVQTIPNGMFAYLSNISGTLSLPNSLISIGSEAFYGCSGFTGNLLIPNLVNTIGFFAFRECSGFDGTLTLGNSVVTIGDNAFYKCYGLTGELVIPNSVETIGIGAFIDCDFTKITIGTGVFSMATSVFRRCANLTEVEWNATNCQLAGNTEYPIFNECSSLASVTFGDNVQNIPAYAFYNCASFTGNLDLPNSLISIGDQAFYNCYGFEGIVMSNSVETIGNEAFRNCGGLRGELTLPETLVSVGTYAFAGCTDIGTLNYNAINCETMGNASQNVFAECFSLTHLHIGENVESIPNYAFKPCFLLQDMNVGAVVPPVIQVSTFGAISRSIPVHVPYGSGEAYRNAPYWEEFFNITEDYSPSQYTCHWNANPNQFEGNMTVTGIIQINGLEQATDKWEIGAFCGDECRGSQLLAHYPQVDRYLVFLTLYGDPGDLLTFRLYDHEANVESPLGCTTHLPFVTDSIVGSMNDPYVFNFGNMQVTYLAEGWTWYSTYIEQDGNNGLEQLEESLDGNGLIIKSQANGYVTYSSSLDFWYGSLSAINNEWGYLINTTSSCVVTMEGETATPSAHPISLAPGWTWIGYLPSAAMDINAALAGLSATEGDMLKTQHGFASYYPGYGWIGSLRTIEPGKGLMYKSNNSETLTLVYPDSNRGGALRANLTPENNHWKPDTHAYPDNMSVMAVVELNGEEIMADGYELAAFDANGECRGSVEMVFVEPLNRYMAFLTLSGMDAAELTFGLYDAATGREYIDSDERLVFVTNAKVGDANEPYVVRFGELTGTIESAITAQVYPNPVARGERFSIDLGSGTTQSVRVEIVDALGAVTRSMTSAQQPVSIAAPAVSGVYLLRITVEGKGTCIKKLIVR